MRRAVVTGASSGIGAAFAPALAAQGYDLVLVARRRAALEVLAAWLRDCWSVSVEVLAADLADPTDLHGVEAAITARPVTLLINNAGATSLGRFAQLEADAEESLVRLNVLALMRLTRAALPGMIARRHGTIINVSSIAAFVPARYSATYSATKAYVSSFTAALHEELRGTGVRVQLLCPGLTRTEFAARAGADTARIPAFAWMTAESVVAASLTAFDRGVLVCVPGAVNRVLVTMLRVLPRRLTRRLVGAGAKQGWASTTLRNRPD